MDLTAWVLVFPPQAGCLKWRVLPRFFLPGECVQKVSDRDQVPYSAWIRQGFIAATPGEMIDQRAVLDRIRWGRQMFDLREVPYDRFNFRSEALNLVDEGIQAVEVSQNFLLLSHPTKFLLGAYVDQKIRHGNNPVLNWMASCLQLQYDHKDNCQPAKPKRGRSSKRIDGIQATITGLTRAILGEDNSITYTGLRSVG